MNWDRKITWRAMMVALLALGVVWIAVSRVPEEEALARSDRPPAPQAGFAAPDFTLETRAGEAVSLADMRGQVVLLNFWATWCPPCLREMPLFVDLQKEYQGEGVQFVAVAIDDKSAVLDFAASHSINFPILLGDLETVALSRQLGNRLEGLPFTAIFDRFGKLVYSRAGEMTRSSLEQNLQAMLEAER